MKEYTYCPKHGRQPAIGNWEECEACVLEDAEEQEYKRVLDTAKTGKY